MTRTPRTTAPPAPAGRTLRALLLAVAATAALAAGCASDSAEPDPAEPETTEPETDDAPPSEAPSPSAEPATTTQPWEPLDSSKPGCRVRQGEDGTGRYSLPDGTRCDPSEAVDNSTISPEELMPPEPGVMPRLMLGYNPETGETTEVHAPPETAAVITWSDWCYFEGPGPWACANEMAHFSLALSHLEADESCVLEQHRLYFSAPNTRPGEARDAHGWHRCPTAADPTPDDGLSLLAKCEALAERDPRVQQWLDSRTSRFENGCAGWTAFQQNLAEPFHAPACSAARGLGVLYLDATIGDEALTELGLYFEC